MAQGESDNTKREIRDKDITGLKYFEKLLPLFERLHEVRCERDVAGNRDVHFDVYRGLVLHFLMVAGLVTTSVLLDSVSGQN